MTRINLEFRRGTTKTFSGVLRDSSGAVVDLTNATMTWRMGEADGIQTRLTLSESDGITVSAPTTGAWSITIDPGDTSSLDPRCYIHQGKAVIGSATYDFTDGRVTLRRDLD